MTNPMNLPENKKYHLYISRSQHEEDRTWVDRLVGHLKQHKWSMFFFDDDFNPNLNFNQNIEKGMKSSLKIIFVLSRHHLSNKRCKLETEIGLTLYLSHRKSSNLIPLMISECELPEYLMPLRYIDARKTEEEWLPLLMNALSESSTTSPTAPLPEGKHYHAFFVYRTVVPDKEWVRNVAESLEEHESGFKCAFHERDFIPGRTIFENITYFLKCSLKVVVVLTPEFLKSEWTKFETELAQLLSMTTADSVKIIPVVIQHCDIPVTLINLTYLDATDAFPTWWPKLLKTINIPNEELMLKPPSSKDSTQTLQLTRFSGKLETDLCKSWLIDLKFIDDGTLIVSDARNKKLKHFSFKGDFNNEITFENRPMFFAYFNDNIIYVTFPDEDVVRIISIDALRETGQITVPRQCSGIAMIDQNRFALTCREQGEIRLMTRSGEIERIIKPFIGVNETSYHSVYAVEDDANDSEEEANNIGQGETVGKKDFSALKKHRKSISEANNPPRLVWPGFIDASETQIFVTDYQTSLLTIINIDNEFTFHHRSVPLVDPRGVTIHDNKLYIAAGTVRIYTLDGEAITEQTLHGSPVNFPRSITFDRTGHYMAITHKGDGDDFITIFHLLSI